jgi:HEPN domain-containing protein
MKPFALYHSFREHFESGEQKMRQLLLEIVNPDAVYILGATLNRRRTESIFSPSSPSAGYISGYFLLVIIPEAMNKELYEWQEQIEQHLKQFRVVTVIVLETITFTGWLSSGHPFAQTVVQSTTPLYSQTGVRFCVSKEVVAGEKKNIANAVAGLEKAKEFMAGAELYVVRKQNKLAAFMLHQSVEHALNHLIKTTTGYHSHTHNLERLFRYAEMVSYQLPDIFPRNTEREKQLFKLLQKAYTDARYSENYSIGFREIQSLAERVKDILELAENCCKVSSQLSCLG